MSKKKTHPMTIIKLYSEALGINLSESNELSDEQLLSSFLKMNEQEVGELNKVTNDWIFTWKDRDASKSTIGSKAYGLWQLGQVGMAVPPWLAIKATAFESYIFVNPQLNELREKLRTRSLSKMNLLGAAEDLRNAILETPIHESLVDAVKFSLRSLSIPFPVAIRSSALLEDLPGATQAGAYDTYLNVQADGIELAIRKCWASLFGRRAVLGLAQSGSDLHATSSNLWKDSMPVIVQQMINGDRCGVIFTADPLSGNKAFVTIEASSIAAGVVSGDSTPARYLLYKGTSKLLNKIEAETQNDLLSATELNKLQENGVKSEDIFGTPQDVEWAIHDGEVSILQSRPINIVHGSFSKLEQVHIISTEESQKNGEMNFGDCEGVAKTYEKKKFPLRRIAKKLGVQIPAWYWIEYDIESLEKFPQSKLESLFQADYILIDLSSNFRGMQIPKKDLHSFLLSVVKDHPKKHLTALLRDAFDTEIGAVSGLLPDGSVVIEYAVGTLKGVLSGIAETSTLWVSEHDEILKEDIVIQKYALLLDKKTFEIGEKPIGEVETYLNPKVVQEINLGTRKIVQEISDARPEWWIIKDQVYLFDVSKEDNSLESLGGVILSPGSARGNALVINNLDAFSGLADGWAVSVGVANSEIKDLPELRDYVSKFEEAKKQGDVILIAPKAHVALAGFLDYFSGCVFTSGGLLSHLAITLRERNIPAVIYRDALDKIQDGMIISIENGILSISSQ